MLMLYLLKLWKSGSLIDLKISIIVGMRKDTAPRTSTELFNLHVSSDGPPRLTANPHALLVHVCGCVPLHPRNDVETSKLHTKAM